MTGCILLTDLGDFLDQKDYNMSIKTVCSINFRVKVYEV